MGLSDVVRERPPGRVATAQRDRGWQATLAELRAALESGTAPGAALAAVGDGPLEAAARAVRLGCSLADAARLPQEDPQVALLLRGLALAEVAGQGALHAIDQVVRAGEAADEQRRLLDVHTVQARGAALLLVGLPIALWAVLVLLDPGTMRFYTTPLGAGSGVLAVGLVLLAWRWSRRIIAAAGRAGERADPLAVDPPPRRPARAVAFGLPMALVMGVLVGPGLGLAMGTTAAAIGLRRPRDGDGEAAPSAPGVAAGTPADRAVGGAAVIELVGIALAAGMTPVGAVAAVGDVVPPWVRAHLHDAARRLRGGWDTRAAFADGPLADVGEVLAASAKWGAPAAPALRRLAAHVRAEQRAAVAAAAERTQLFLIFPTTLLMLPAFVLAVVAPLVWSAFTGSALFSDV